MTRVERHFIKVDERLVHYRRAGRGPVLLALHQSPRESGELLPLIRAMAPFATVIAPDNPGFGLSDPLPPGPATMDRFAQALDRFMDALGLGKVALYGLHTGACIANRFAARYPHRVTGLVVDGFMLMEEGERADLLAHYLPPFHPQWDGGHLAWAWHRIRDQGIFFPWYRREPSTRLNRPKPDLSRIHEQIMEFLRAGDSYRTGYEAALSYRPADDMAGLEMPSLLFAAQDDPLHRYLAKLPPLPDGVTAGTAPDRATAWHVITDFLRLQLPDGDAPPPPAFTARGVTDGIAWVAGGKGVPLLRLHDLGGSGTLLAPPAEGAWLAPDLPGMGDSELVADPGDIPAVADVLAGLLKTRGWTGGVVEGWGYGARIAAELARRHPALVTELRAHGGLTEKPTTLTPAEGGGYLLAAWQQARDGHLFPPGDGVLPGPERLQVETWYWLKAARVLERAWGGSFES
ncbi:alpha/beta fold hydrolase [Niveispirillum sp. KHB5.9]|uniref:alpha/beta fold hydrolase n=1 Tax=Niveispirillum sp. KHB5.9 TaxID=3400269 RepID=UPI003A84F139